MFESYLFVPANKKKFIEKSSQLKKLDHRIFDLEDSIAEKDIKVALDNLKLVESSQNNWIRIPIGSNEQSELIKAIHELGFYNYVIPKYTGYEEFKRIFSDISSINNHAKFILLIENPKLYIELVKTLDEFASNIYGISLGIHDFASESGMKNDYKIFKDIRVNIMLIAKAYSIKPLDVASMILKDRKEFEEEIVDGFELGYRGKLLIHPYQLEVLNDFAFYTIEQIKKYGEVLTYYKENVENEGLIFTFKGKVYEKMHISEIKKIVKWGLSFYGPDW